jgi:hypothetical protein
MIIILRILRGIFIVFVVLLFIAGGLCSLGLLFACFDTVHDYLGIIGVIACVLTGIVTAIPVALIALLFHAQWSLLGRLIGAMALSYILLLLASGVYEWKGPKQKS